MDILDSQGLGGSELEDKPPFVHQLASIDWAFSLRSSALEIESVHPYPAKFIGEIPRTLIRHLPFPRSTAVFDPFCGSGTTLVEAQRAGFETIGIDLNPIACLLSRVKTAPLPRALKEAASSVTDDAQRDNDVVVPVIPNINHWFKPEVQQAVGAITQTIAKAEYREWFDHLRLALSSILVKVSNQESDTRYAAIDKPITYEDVFVNFKSAVGKLERALLQRDWAIRPVQIIEGDTLEVRPSSVEGPVGLVITSPPYPNAYEYWLYHKYRMWWLGFDPIAVKDKEIGARAHFFKKNHHTADLFVDQMRKAFSLIDRVLVRNGYVCFVVGRSQIHGKLVDNSAIIERVAREGLFVPITRFERVISPNRKSFNLSHANIKTESILVFKKK